MNKNHFERVVVVTNPASTRSEVVTRQIDDIRRRFTSQVIEIATHPQPSDTTAMLKDQLRGDDVVVMAGGDGTARTAVEAMADPIVPAHDAVLLPLLGGHRNDLAHQLHSNRAFAQPSAIIDHAATVDIMPLSTSWEDGGEVNERLSALYTGIGAMATTAHYISSPRYRQKAGYELPFMRDLYGLGTLPWTIRNVDSVAVESSGSIYQLVDATLANADVVAQYLHPPVSLAEHKAFYTELRTKSPHEVVPYILRMMLQPWVAPPAHQIAYPGEGKTLTPLEDTYIHTDGDAERIAAGTPITLGVHATPFRAFYSRHRVLRAVRGRRA